MINNISTYGYDVIRPMIAAATFASAGAAFGVFLKAKIKKIKHMHFQLQFQLYLENYRTTNCMESL